MRLAVSVAALGAAALLALPAGAGAATVAASSSVLAPGTTPQAQLTFTAAPGEANRLTVSAPAVAIGEVTLRDEGAPLTPGAGCEPIDDHTAICSPRRAVGPAGPAPAAFSATTVRLGDGADQAGADNGVAVSMFGEAGDDVLTGSAHDDLIDGGQGRDRLDGGPGDDVFAEDDESAPDQIDGGVGRDRLSYRRRRRAVRVELSRRRGADGDPVTRVEDVTGGARADRITGNSRSNFLDGGAGDDMVLGGGGLDRLTGGPGRDLLSGGPGRDTLDVQERGRATGDRARCGRSVDVVAGVASLDRLAKDCEWALLGGLLVHQPLRAQRSGTVDVQLSVPKDRPRFRGRVALRYRGILLGRPSRELSLAPQGRTTAHLALVGPALSRLREMRRLRIEVVVDRAAFTTELRAPLAPPTGTGGTPS